MIEYSLSQLLEIADKGFKTLFSGFDFWWKAEILKIQQKGKYVYTEMVEYDAEGKISARVKGCIFDEHIYQKFLQTTRLWTVEEMTGIKILFHGRFSFHKDYNFSIIIDELSSEYTIGHMQQNHDNIMLELHKLGIAHKNKTAPWWYPSYTIAVISADGAAGLKDFQAVLDQSGYNIEYKTYFGAMHGNNAIADVSGRLQQITEEITHWEQIDAVAIIRGWGESSGIAWQNDLEIAKLICLMPVPVMVAVGHTQDRFVLQDVAWYGAKTPTDAAYRLIEQLDQWDEHLNVLYDSVLTLAADKILTIRENVEQRHLSVGQKLTYFLRHARLQIDSWYNTINAVSPKKLLQSGYALLQQQWEYLTRESTDALNIGDELDIQVYDKSFSVKITKIK